jgi:maltooligosyltrehalose trehalohydrolase
VPDPQAPETFERSQLRWSERSAEPHRSVLDWYRALIRLRRTTSSLSDGNYQEARVSIDEEAGWLIVRRGAVLIVCNFAGEPRQVPVDFCGRLLLASHTGVRLSQNVCGLPAESAAILHAND